MKPSAFAYLRPRTLDEALAALAAEGDEARILAGGQSLVAMLNMRLARPALLIDVMHLPDAATIRREGDSLVIPAATRQAALQRHPALARELPLVAAMLPWIGHEQTRARGTVCGSVAHADPSAELPLALVALGGAVDLQSRRRRRRVGAGDFFRGMMLTAAEPDEMITAVRFPVLPQGTGTAFAETGRRHGDFAIVACAAVVRGTSVRLAVGGVNDVPSCRDWNALEPDQIEDALNEFAWSLDARDDLHATARYRREMVRRLGHATIKEAARCAA